MFYVITELEWIKSYSCPINNTFAGVYV
jgi:hypothetical protein